MQPEGVPALAALCPDRTGRPRHLAAALRAPEPVQPASSATQPGVAQPDAKRGCRVPRDCGPLPFLIQRDGTWLYQGTPIRRKPMVCLFSSVLRRGAAGRYRLETPAERGEIEVEDVPFVAVELEWQGCGRAQVLAFRTNVDEIVCAGPDHPLVVDWSRARCGDVAPIPYLTVRPGDGALPIQARVARAVYYELAAIAVEGTRPGGEPCMGVWSQNRFFPIGPCGDVASCDGGA